MKKLRGIPKILKINYIKGYKVSFLFNNGASGWIDFQDYWKDKREGHPAYKLLQNQEEFAQIEIMGNTIGWKNTGISSKNSNGEIEFFPYDLDPIVLYDACLPDDSQRLKVGNLIRDARKKAGLTQAELAQKSGTSKHYISKLENDKLNVELRTLQKIIEAGLGKVLTLTID